MNREDHPSPGELTRFVLASNNSDSRVDAHAVEHHLRSGCLVCREAVRRLREIAREEPFPGAEFDSATWVLPRRIALSDHGLRGTLSGEQQLVCDVDTYELDVMVHRDGDALSISGRLLRNGGEAGPVPDAALRLVDADTLAHLDDATTNAFGEFELFADGRRSCGIRVLGDRPRYVLVWTA
jgi:hypothetical protein